LGSHDGYARGLNIEFPRRILTQVLILAAGADRLVDTAATEEFASRLKAGKCITLVHARHEILMERDPFREEFWAAFDAFLSGESTRGDHAASTGTAG
jgi:lysophospholipase